MKNLFLIFLVILISCGVENKFEEELKSFVGKDYNAVIAEWGHPTDIYETPNSNDVLYYLRIKDVTSPFPNYLDEDGKEIPNNCRIYFEIGKDLKIIKYSYKGNYCWIE
ncbi:MAG: hypothetical protein DRQ88_12005 [Epsilonproteobacteria bacterium]|nr:MAG: hypothetical protein DRQ89_11605 [Campylobacterota bacterium]RLA63763.1 MAG: hypothetical protein DRQ88_12005 [Campylobacterota bacterium]